MNVAAWDLHDNKAPILLGCQLTIEERILQEQSADDGTRTKFNSNIALISDSRFLQATCQSRKRKYHANIMLPLNGINEIYFHIEFTK